MKKTFLAIAALVAAFFVPAKAEPPFFRTVVQLQALCVHGGPGPIISQLRSQYNEQVVHGMDLTSGALSIQMYIAENVSNPSATLFLHNQNANGGLGQTCIFWSANSVLKTDDDVEVLPPKRPVEGETDA